MNGIELKALQKPLLLLVIVLAIAAAAVYYTDTLQKSAQSQLAQQQKQLKEARTRLQKSGDEKDVIVRYVGGYQQLTRAGFIGEEQRINWLDGLRNTNQQIDLFGIDYQISAQRPYVYSSEFNPGQLSMFESIMKLRFRLLHEGDLPRFFDALTQQNVGVFNVDQCIVKRIETSGVIRYQPNLMADCEISWLTLRAPATEKK